MVSDSKLWRRNERTFHAQRHSNAAYYLKSGKLAALWPKPVTKRTSVNAHSSSGNPVLKLADMRRWRSAKAPRPRIHIARRRRSKKKSLRCVANIRIADELAKGNNWVPLVSPNTVKRILKDAGLWPEPEATAKKGALNRQSVPPKNRAKP